jgi:ElaB/YqjD/DUF883 family membrane-anchored ribosome-binding protein
VDGLILGQGLRASPYAREGSGASAARQAAKRRQASRRIIAMADTTPAEAPDKPTPSRPAKGGTAGANGPARARTRKTGATRRGADAPPPAPASENQAAVAKSRFNAALEEAKAAAAALRAEAGSRVGAHGKQAREKGGDLLAEAKAYGEQALGKAGELAVEGKKVASDALASLGKVVGESAAQLDEKLGEPFGDYARKAARSLQETSARLDSKSLAELGEDAREMVRKSPGLAVGIAAAVGFFLARLLGGKRG